MLGLVTPPDVSRSLTVPPRVGGRRAGERDSGTDRGAARNSSPDTVPPARQGGHPQRVATCSASARPTSYPALAAARRCVASIAVTPKKSSGAGLGTRTSPCAPPARRPSPCPATTVPDHVRSSVRPPNAASTSTRAHPAARSAFSAVERYPPSRCGRPAIRYGRLLAQLAATASTSSTPLS